jgi:PIN domain nuclease of toxin-antitoxin system
MKLLLDTHTFIWWDSAPAQLSAVACALVINEKEAGPCG